MKEIVAVIGRPNVGKSSLFNRLVQKKLAIVHNMPGVTRDRNYANANWDDYNYLLVDTGGIDFTEDKEIFKEMMEQANMAMEEATKIIFMMDAKDGVNVADEELVNYLRKFKDKEIFYVVNKIDTPDKEDIVLADFYSLGIPNLYPMSAQSKRGITELMDDVFKNSTPTGAKESQYLAKIAVIGKPNVGKSSLINKLLGQDRLLVHDEAGTTRDSIDTEVTYYKNNFLFIDTAGVRRKARIKYSLEKFMVVKAFISIDRADVVLLVIDATQMITDQDRRLIGLAQEKGKPIIILVNKWDLIEKDAKTHKKFKEELEYELKELVNPEVLFISALNGQRVFKIFDIVSKVMEQSSLRISTGELNRFMQEVINGRPHPIVKSKKVNMKYISQVATNPPVFMISTNHSELIRDSYTRFILNQLRKRYNFGSVPIRVLYRSTSKPSPT